MSKTPFNSKLLTSSVWAAVLALLVAACAPAGPASPAAAPAKQASEPASSSSAAKPAVASNTTRADYIKKANEEGELIISAASSLGEQNTLDIVAAMNKHYGTNIKGTYVAAGNYDKVTAQILSERASGSPTMDLFVTNDGYEAILWDNGALEQVPYVDLGVNPEAVLYESHAITFANQLALPAYNTKLVSKEEAPKTWEDLLDPKWKGKLGLTNSVHHMVRLSYIWGDDKTTAYAKELAKQDLRLGNYGDTANMLELGEISVLWTMTDSYMIPREQKGSPITWARDVRPAIATQYTCGPIKGAPNPHAAALFCAFLNEEPAQKVWDKAQGLQNVLNPNTEVGAIYAKDKKSVALIDGKFAVNELPARQDKYAEIVGWKK